MATMPPTTHNNSSEKPDLKSQAGEDANADRIGHDDRGRRDQ
jgi:hypothetical protein